MMFVVLHGLLVSIERVPVVSTIGAALMCERFIERK